MTRKSLTEILKNGADRDQLRRQWTDATPADDFGKPLPRGEYVANIINGELFSSKTNQKPGYKLCFEVVEGEHVRRKLWHDLYLSEAAISMAKRDLLKIGVVSIDQLDQPLPPGIRCRLHVVVRKGDDGSERNEIRTFEVIGVDPPQLDPYAPQPANDAAVIAPPSTTPITTVNASPDEIDGGKD